jgi:outer membrane protein assembly factor BamB
MDFKMENTNKRWLPLSLFLAVAFHAMAAPAGSATTNQRADRAGDWPQWRGPGGLGVSSEPNLPEVWDCNSPNIKWKVSIPGDGVSSPVVSNGRVVLTTAFESPGLLVAQEIVRTASLGLAVVLLGAILLSLIKSLTERFKKDTQPGQTGVFAYFDCILTATASVCFICAALVAILRPQYFALISGNFDLLTSIANGHRFPLLAMNEGAPAPLWLTSGAIVLLGVATAAGWMPKRSVWRLGAALAAFVSAVLLVMLTPLDEWKFKIALHKRLIFALPGLLVVSWHTFIYWKVRLKEGMQRGIGGVGVLLPVVATLSLSALIFVPPNFMRSQRGLQRAVVCIDAQNGAILWTKTVFTTREERKHTDNTYATPTPATDGTHIVAGFGAGFACLDFEGHVLWRNLDPAYFKNSRYGAAASPLLARDTVIIVQEKEDYSKRPTWIAAFDKNTGKPRWKIEPENVHGCYTTPLLYQDDHGTQLIISSWEIVASYDTASGQSLWTTKTPLKQLVASMARSGTLLCVTGGTWGPKSTVVMRLSGTDRHKNADILWQSEHGAGGTCSPVIYAGRLYTLSDTGEMTCFDAPSGTALWHKRLRGRFLSSLVAGDGKIYACNTKGVTTVLAADTRFKILAENPLQGRCYASPALANGCIFIRIGDVLYCIQKQHQPISAAAEVSDVSRSRNN